MQCKVEAELFLMMAEEAEKAPVVLVEYFVALSL